jgi:RimJ/RimL family protein N-acetyltransferase
MGSRTDELTDGVVTLRPMTPADAERHLAGEDEPTARFLSGGRSTMETVLASIERNRVSRETSGPVRSFGICVAATGTLVGMVEANMAAPGFRPGVANISYGLYPEARGNGYATRAVDLLTRYLVDHTAADVAAIQVHPENLPSARLPGRIGFRFLGVRKTSESDRMMTYAKSLRRDAELGLTDVCQE